MLPTIRRVCATAFVLTSFAAIGCQPIHRSPDKSLAPVPATRPVASAKPLIDFSRGAAGFPLVGHVKPDSSEHLTQELTAGYAERIAMPTTRPTVLVDGEFPNLQSIIINLSGGTVKNSYRPSSLKSVSAITPVASVKYLEYNASPLLFEHSAQTLRLTAYDAKLGILHGKGEREVLVLTDTTAGHAHFDIDLADFRAMVEMAAKEGASRFAIFVQEAHFNLFSENPRSLSASLRVRGFWLLVPVDFTITGRVDVDKNFIVTTSQAGCHGNDVGGKLLGGFIDGALQKYNGKVMPLASFPGDRIRMKDLRVQVDDGLHVDADFGNSR